MFGVMLLVTAPARNRCSEFSAMACRIWKCLRFDKPLWAAHDSRMLRSTRIAFAWILLTLCAHAAKDDGYRGIWYYNQPSHDEYKYKYSGGFATYPQQHEPIAIYAPAVKKTFFVYGGTTAR